MTNEEAQKMLTEIRHYLTAGNPVWDVDKVGEAMAMAIEALKLSEIPTGSDLISRQAALDSISYDVADTYDRIKSLPSAEPKTGTCARSHTGIIGEGFYCSRCGKMGYKTDFCPNCGADMRGEKHE